MPSQLADFNALVASGQELSLEDSRPASLLISGQTVAASRGGFRAGLDLELGGQMPDDEIIFRVRRAVLTAAGVTVAEEKPITWLASTDNPANRALRIKKIGSGAQDDALTLTCSDPAK